MKEFGIKVAEVRKRLNKVGPTDLLQNSHLFSYRGRNWSQSMSVSSKRVIPGVNPARLVLACRYFA